MSLYRDEVLDHYRHPQNFGKPESFTHSYEEENRTCGDRQTVYLTVENNVIKETHFEGNGCAISMATSSLLSEFIKGKSIEAVKSLSEDDVVKLLGSTVSPGRLNCAMLGLKSFQKAITSVEREAFSVQTQNADKIAKDSNLGEIAAQYPQAARVFTEYGLHCVGCFASAFDTLEAGASLHGMSQEEIEDMIRRANEEILSHPEETIQENFQMPISNLQ